MGILGDLKHHRLSLAGVLHFLEWNGRSRFIFGGRLLDALAKRILGPLHLGWRWRE